MRDAFIIDAVRTPRARRKGKFTGVHPVDLLTYPLNSIVGRNHVAPASIEDVVIGCVTQCGEQAWCVARAAVLAAGWPYTVPATTINRLCASSQQAANFVAQGIQSGAYDLALAGGLEHMTRVPMFSDSGGQESPLLKKHHPDLVQQGMAAELVAEKYGFTRLQLDEFSVQSQRKAKQARDEKRFSRSLIPISYTDEQGTPSTLDFDDGARPETNMQALSGLKTVFKENGLITAGNSSAIVDGASALLLASESKAKELGLRPRARIVAAAVIGSDPRLMLTGPIEASKQVLKRAGLPTAAIDLWEINEAFAPIPLATIRELGIDPLKVNVNGGAIALGHPLGASGAILIGTAMDELERTSKRYALITMCIGLGMGTATIIERLS